MDSERIGLSGHSLGTESNWFLALLDGDVKAVVHNDFVCRLNQRIISCHPPERFLRGAYWHLIPNMLEWLDLIDLLAACAPTKLLICEGGVTEDLLTIRRAYEIAGVPENFKYLYYPEYQDESNRHYDNLPIPENISTQEHLKYANVNANRHFFKNEVAVPWLTHALGCTH